MNEKNSYNGNSLVKRDGVVHEYTQHEIDEYKKCMNSVEYFCENYVKVISLDKGLVPFKLRGYQTDLVNQYDKNRFNIVLACRQSGKCGSINTIVTVRNKKTGVTEKITFGELYERQNSRNLAESDCGK